jgi:hypothetical protein
MAPPRGSSTAHHALLIALGACALVAGLVAAKATRDALFLTNFASATLPRVMTASAVLSVAAVLLMSRLMTRSSPRRVLLAGLSTAVSLVLLEWGLTFVLPRLAAVIVHLHVAVFGATLLSAFWSMVNERFDPYTGKRVMGRIGAGAALGGMVGGALAYLAARTLPVPSMLLSVALLDGLALLLLLRLPHPERAAAVAATGPVQLPAALRILREGSYLRHLAWLVALGALVESLLDYGFNAQAAATLGRGPALASFLAAYHTGVSVLAFLAQSLLTRSSLEGLGLAGTVGVRPLAVAVSSLVALLEPRLLSLLVARGAHAVLTTSLFRSAYELLFTPVPSESKRPTKTLIDVGFDKVGAVAGSLLALLVVSLLREEAVRVLLGLSVVTALLSVLVTSWLHAGYVGALEASLRSGALQLEVDEVKDATTRFFYTRATDRESVFGAVRPTPEPARGEADRLASAIADLRSGQRGPILRALPAGSDPDLGLVPFLIPLLANEAVLGEVVRSLRRVAPRIIGQLTDALLDPRQPALVRRRVPRVLVAAPTERTAEGLLRGLEDGRFDVRARCGLALMRVAERNPELKVPRDAVFAACLRELERDGRSADDTTSGLAGSHDDVVEHVFTLLSAVLEREPMQLASRALRSGDRALIGTALEYLETVLPDELRRALWKRLHVGARDRPEPRPSHELLDELLRSSDALRGPRRGLRRRGSGERG